MIWKLPIRYDPYIQYLDPWMSADVYIYIFSFKIHPFLRIFLWGFGVLSVCTCKGLSVYVFVFPSIYFLLFLAVAIVLWVAVLDGIRWLRSCQKISPCSMTYQHLCRTYSCKWVTNLNPICVRSHRFEPGFCQLRTRTIERNPSQCAPSLHEPSMLQTQCTQNGQCSTSMGFQPT